MEFEEYINEVTRKTIQEGGSASKPSSCIFSPIQDLWCFPKYPAKTSIFPPHINLAEELKNFIKKNITFLNEVDCWLGTWVNPQTGEYYLDISTGIENLEAARSVAIQVGQKDGREIVAMFNPKRRHTVFLKSV